MAVVYTHIDACLTRCIQRVLLLDRRLCWYRAILGVRHALVVIRVSSYLSYVIESTVFRQDNAGARKFYRRTRSIMVARSGSNSYRQRPQTGGGVMLFANSKLIFSQVSLSVAWISELRLLRNVKLEFYLMHQCHASYLITGSNYTRE